MIFSKNLQEAKLSNRIGIITNIPIYINNLIYGITLKISKMTTMKKILIISFFINTLLFNLLTFASPSKKFNHFIVRFETGNAYDITIKNNQLRWKGIAGEDFNMIVEVPFKHITLSKNIDVYQWNETRGYFDTFILDRSNAVAITSTKNANNQEWLVKGKVYFLN